MKISDLCSSPAPQPQWPLSDANTGNAGWGQRSVADLQYILIQMALTIVYDSLTSIFWLCPSSNFFYKAWRFGSRLCFRLQARKSSTLVDPSGKVYSQWVARFCYSGQTLHLQQYSQFKHCLRSTLYGLLLRYITTNYVCLYEWRRNVVCVTKVHDDKKRFQQTSRWRSVKHKTVSAELMQAASSTDSRLESRFLKVQVSVNSVRPQAVTIYIPSSCTKILTGERVHIHTGRAWACELVKALRY
jgi:hypothetical protein